MTSCAFQEVICSWNSMKIWMKHYTVHHFGEPQTWKRSRIIFSNELMVENWNLNLSVHAILFWDMAKTNVIMWWFWFFFNNWKLVIIILTSHHFTGGFTTLHKFLLIINSLCFHCYQFIINSLKFWNLGKFSVLLLMLLRSFCFYCKLRSYSLHASVRIYRGGILKGELWMYTG